MAVPFLRLLVGEFGTGKSLRLLEMGLELAEKYKKGIVANFPIDLKQLRLYCRSMGYTWVESLISFGQIKYLPVLRPSELHKILEFKNKVVLLDEAGIFLNARSWSKVPDEFLASLVQVRKDGNFFLLACHFLDQIDKQVRENCQYFIECRSFAVARRGLPLMVFRWWYEFKPSAYHRWLENQQWQNNFFRTYFASSRRQLPKIVCPVKVRFIRPPGSSFSLKNWLFNSRFELVPSSISLLFKCFDSSHRLDKVKLPKNARPTYFLGDSDLPKMNGKSSKSVQFLNF